MEKGQMAEVLKTILACIQYGGNEEKKRLVSMMEDLRGNGCLESFLDFLQEEYGADSFLHGELLRFIALITGDMYVACEWLHVILEEEYKKKSDFFRIFQLKNRCSYQDFYLNKRKDTAKDWEVNEYLNSEMTALLGISGRRILPAERNQDFVIIATTQLLGKDHAPTRLVLEVCRTIESVLKKRALILSVVLKPDIDMLEKRGMRKELFRFNTYVEGLNGNFSYIYREHVCSGYQIVLGEENLTEMRALMETVRNLKPYFVWNFGGVSTYVNAMKEFTTVIYTGLNQGYPGVPADIVVNYFPRARLENTEEREFLIHHGVTVKEIEISLPYEKAKGKISRTDYGIPEEAFCLAVVGNRLKQDCTEAFLLVMRQILEEEPDCWIVFIGEEETGFKDIVTKQIGSFGRLCFLGFQKELCEAIQITDLFVNPPRLGGGTGGILALNEGKPVVTQKEGDVASFAGDSFICASLDEYAERILQYKNDRAYYEKQSSAARIRAEEIFSAQGHMAETVQSIFELVKEQEKERNGDDV